MTRIDGWTDAMAQYRALAETVNARADRVRQSLMDEARQTAVEAGVGQYLGTALHNALLARRQGRPWQGVDYHLARRAQWLIERSYEPGRLVERILARAHNRLLAPLGAPRVEVRS
jgi:hypothetical protein